MPSTVIRTFDYQPERKRLEIEFTTGRRYVYRDVPEAAVAAFRAARSKGRHFNAHIRGRYRFTELSAAAADSPAWTTPAPRRDPRSSGGIREG